MTEVEPGHRKTVKHFDIPRHCHELTFSCFDRRPLLLDDRWRSVLADGITAACLRHAFHLLAFVFMPEHVHLLVAPGATDYCTSAVLYAIKRPVSFRIKQALAASESGQDRSLLGSLMVRERPGKITFRFWQEGPGFDRNFVGKEAAFNAARYIHDNPVKRGLVARADDWEWSSWRAYSDPPRARPSPLVSVDVWRTWSMPRPV